MIFKILNCKRLLLANCQRYNRCLMLVCRILTTTFNWELGTEGDDSVKCIQCMGFWIPCGEENTTKIGQNTVWFSEGDGMRKALHHLSFLHCRGARGQKQSKNQIFLFWNMHQLMSTLREYWNIFDQICKLSQKSLPKYPLLDEDKYLHYLIRLV